MPAGNTTPIIGDTDYKRARNELLYDLIEKSNPGFKSRVSIDSLGFDTLTNIASGNNFADTSIRLYPASGVADFVGSQVLTYRRIDLSKLFRGRTLTVTKFTTNSSITKAEFLDLLLAQHGVRLHTDDVPNTSFTVNTLTVVNIAAGSWCWKGSFSVTWVRGKRNISEFVGDRKLNARNWPQAMIDFQNGSKPQGELLLYHLDYSQFSSEFASWVTGNYVYGSGIDTIVARLNALSTTAIGITFTSGKVSTQPGLENSKLMRYALPNAAVPEANSAEYKWCLTLEPQEEAWFFGKLIIHYN